MQKIIYIFLILISTISIARSQQAVPVYNFNEFEHMLNFNNDTTYVVNFWATWCKPCVKELPAFEKLNSTYANQKVKVVLVSLDFIKNYDSKLLPFIKERDIKSKVVLLNDPRSNRWIDRVSEEWSGAIPATVIYNSTERGFYERLFTYEELDDELSKFLE